MDNLTLNLTPETLDYSRLYNLIQDYPDRTFWLLTIGFVALLAYIYLPIMVRDTRLRTVLNQIMLATSFMFYGFGIFMMIPIHFTMTTQLITTINIVFNLIIVMAIITLSIKGYLYLKKKRRVEGEDKSESGTTNNNRNTDSDFD